MQAIKEGMSFSCWRCSHEHIEKRIIHKNRKHTQTRKRLHRKLKSLRQRKLIRRENLETFTKKYYN